jgi:hypothetical protein
MVETLPTIGCCGFILWHGLLVGAYPVSMPLPLLEIASAQSLMLG